jgi:hypothetical protein
LTHANIDTGETYLYTGMVGMMMLKFE